MSFGEEKKETKVQRWLHGRTLPDDSCGAMLRGGLSWSLAELVPGRAGPCWSRTLEDRPGTRLQDVSPPAPPPPSGRVGGLSIPDADVTRRRGQLRDGAGAIAPACRGVPSTPRAAPFQPRGTQPFRV